ncbi:MAG: hypothetical protein JJ889_11400 [Maricaulis sp.]|nr:hypothetical protein [Maricaulis sp.]
MPVLVVTLAAALVWSGAQSWRRVTDLEGERDRLETRLADQRTALTETLAEASGRAAHSAPGSPEDVRARFEAEYRLFLEALEASGVDISQATGIGELSLGEGVYELSAAWGGSAPMADLLSILARPELGTASVSEFSVRSSPIDGRVDVFIEFRRAFLREDAS